MAPMLSLTSPDEQKTANFAEFLPESLRTLDDPQKDIPRIAKDVSLTDEIEKILLQLPTTHHLYAVPLKSRAAMA